MVQALKRLAIEDMDRVAVVHRAAFDHRLPWLAGRHTPEQDRAYFRDRVFAECEVWVAGNDAIVGFIAFRPDWIDQLYILPHRQREGVGHGLLRISQAASPSLLLWTFQRNTSACRFYEKHGFVAIERTDGRGNEEREPDVLYRWDDT